MASLQTKVDSGALASAIWKTRSVGVEKIAKAAISCSITVNVVAPGPISDTEMFESVMSPESERAKTLARAIPVGRLGKSSDVARAVGFFSSPDAGFITGQTLYVCGGASIGSISI